MSFQQKRIQTTSRLTLSVFVFNVLFPLISAFFFPAYLANAAVSTSDTLSSDQIIFCTSEGIKLIDLASFQDGSYLNKLDSYPNIEAEAEHEPHHTTQTHLKCMLCVVSNSAFLPLTHSQWTTRLASQRSALVSYSTTFKQSQLYLRGWHSRAPPVAL